MSLLFVLLAIGFAIAALGASIVILIDMFQDAWWKALLALFCGLYFLYYAIFEFEHDNKWMLVLLWLGGGTIAGGFLALA